MSNPLEDVDRWLRRLRPGSRAFWLVCLAPALFVATVIAIKDGPQPRIWVVVGSGLSGLLGTALVLFVSRDRQRSSSVRDRKQKRRTRNIRPRPPHTGTG